MMEMENIELGDVYYVPFKECGGRGKGVLKGYIIEINTTHQTVLFSGIEPYTTGNFGAELKDIYMTETEAYMEL